MSPHGIAGPVNQNSQKSLKTCYASLPLIVSNFIAQGQTMYKKSVTIVYILHYFGYPGGPLEQKFTNLGGDVQ